MLADVEVDTLNHTVWHGWPLARGGLISLGPLPGKRVQLTLLLRRGTVMPELSEDGIRLFINNALGARRFPISSMSWVSIYRPKTGFRLADRFRVDRVFLAGDAAPRPATQNLLRFPLWQHPKVRIRYLRGGRPQAIQSPERDCQRPKM